MVKLKTWSKRILCILLMLLVFIGMLPVTSTTAYAAFDPHFIPSGNIAWNLPNCVWAHTTKVENVGRLNEHTSPTGLVAYCVNPFVTPTHPGNMKRDIWSDWMSENYSQAVYIAAALYKGYGGYVYVILASPFLHGSYGFLEFGFIGEDHEAVVVQLAVHAVAEAAWAVIGVRRLADVFVKRGDRLADAAFGKLDVLFELFFLRERFAAGAQRRREQQRKQAYQGAFFHGVHSPYIVIPPARKRARGRWVVLRVRGRVREVREQGQGARGRPAFRARAAHRARSAVQVRASVRVLRARARW